MLLVMYCLFSASSSGEISSINAGSFFPILLYGLWLELVSFLK